MIMLVHANPPSSDAEEINHRNLLRTDSSQYVRAKEEQP